MRNSILAIAGILVVSSSLVGCGSDQAPMTQTEMANFKGGPSAGGAPKTADPKVAQGMANAQASYWARHKLPNMPGGPPMGAAPGGTTPNGSAPNGK